MIVLNDAIRIWSDREHLDGDTVETIQEFAREYLLATQQALCEQILQRFSVTVFASGVKDGGQKPYSRQYFRAGEDCTELISETDFYR